MGNNMNRLGEVFTRQMLRAVKSNTQATLELGTINRDLSLSVDGLTGRIDRGDYMIDIRLTHDDYDTDDTLVHNHRLPSPFRKPRAGDRVLVAWVGFEPIIVAIVVAGDTTTS